MYIVNEMFSILECEVNPSPGRCSDSEKRTFWTYSSKTSNCEQTTGCYSLSDRNVFLTRSACRRNCVISRPNNNAPPNIIPVVPVINPANVTSRPIDVAYTVNNGMFLTHTVSSVPTVLVSFEI